MSNKMKHFAAHFGPNLNDQDQFRKGKCPPACPPALPDRARNSYLPVGNSFTLSVGAGRTRRPQALLIAGATGKRLGAGVNGDNEA